MKKKDISKYAVFQFMFMYVNVRTYTVFVLDLF